MINNKDIFNSIYTDKVWGDGSGIGSNPIHAKDWIDIVNKTILEKQVKTVLDLGCGDWQIGKHINFDSTEYTGVDVSNVVLDLAKKYERKNIKFIDSDILEFNFPKVDLILIKDVLQHLSVDSVKIIMNKIFKSAKYALISNDFRSSFNPNNINNLKSNGGHMSVDLQSNPFNYELNHLIDFKSYNDIKRIYLYEKK